MRVGNRRGREEDGNYDNGVSYLVNEERRCHGERRGVVPPQLEEVHERAAEGGRRIHRPDSGSARLPPGRRGRALGRLAFFLSEAVASSAAKDVDDARLCLRRAEISSQQMADASDVVVGRCGAGHWRHRRPSPSSGGR